MKLTWALLRIQSQINLVPGKMGCETFLKRLFQVWLYCWVVINSHIRQSFTLSSLQGHFEIVLWGILWLS